MPQFVCPISPPLMRPRLRYVPCNFSPPWRTFLYEPQPLQLGSMGALLDYLVRDQALGDLEPEGLRGLDVRGIVNLAL